MRRGAQWAGLCAGLAAVAGVALWPVTTRYGVDYHWSVRRITLGEKIIDFISRDLQGRGLAREIVDGAATPEVRLRRLLAWMPAHVRPTPDGFPVVDDHLLHVLIRGYGAPDQRTEAFALLATYAGVPACAVALPAPGTGRRLDMALVRVRGALYLVDVVRAAVVSDAQGRWVAVEELLARPAAAAEAAAGLPAVGGVPYARYLAGLSDVRPTFWRMDAQQPWPRLWREVLGWLGVRA